MLRLSIGHVGIFAQLPYARVITAESLAARLRELDDIGVGPEGVYRLAWTEEDAATRAWFERQAADVGLRVAARSRRQPVGLPGPGPAVVGDRLAPGQRPGRRPLRRAARAWRARSRSRPIGGRGPVAVLSFADEEGARFNTPTFGSKALAGRLDLPAVLSRRDDAGVALGDAMRAAGVDPDGIGEAPGWLEKLAGFVEIHIDQTTELARAGEPVGVVSVAGRPDPARGACSAGAPITPAPRRGPSAATRCRRRRG